LRNRLFYNASRLTPSRGIASKSYKETRFVLFFIHKSNSHCELTDQQQPRDNHIIMIAVLPPFVVAGTVRAEDKGTRNDHVFKIEIIIIWYYYGRPADVHVAAKLPSTVITGPENRFTRNKETRVQSAPSAVVFVLNLISSAGHSVETISQLIILITSLTPIFVCADMMFPRIRRNRFPQLLSRINRFNYPPRTTFRGR